MAGVFGHPGYARFWAADTVSAFGTYVTTVALPIVAIATLRATDAEVGLINGARWAPYLLFGLLAGVMADRYRRRPILVVTDLARAVLLALIASLALTGMLTVPALMLLVAVFGVMSLLYEAAHQSYLPGLVPTAALTRANARMEQSASLAQTTGPFLGGSLVAAVGAPAAMVVDAVSYLLSGLLLATIRRNEPVPHPGRRDLGRELREGLAWVYRHPVLAPYAVTLHARFLFASVASTVFTLFVVRGLDPGLPPDRAAFGLGVVLAVGGVGAVVGTSLSHVAGRWGAGRAIVVERVVEPLGWTLVALAVTGTAGWVMVGVAQFLIWLVLGVSGPNEMGYRQAVTPDRLQGRMNATIRSLNWGMLTVGAPVGGLLAQYIGYRPAIWIGVAGMAVAATAAALSPLRNARHPEPTPPPEPAVVHG
ncbi:Predicted arabinose efflux permease, MFS family [Micromonospora rhizosphaerae]|uniref:Predicted arabinose efflux permease, MFS family n=1 Tax=Micromonospora rhizosphaerae TaxID=568872 RepID=A0A1C6T8C9_9ACTN|nr:MFS transporter [Micromonospora rhizosphaerae]SCL38066.1 Predicted arabinose efflux permease, MFS family [Micromonospora rhizosphaerae]